MFCGEDAQRVSELQAELRTLSHGFSGVSDAAAVAYDIGRYAEVAFLKRFVGHGTYGQHESIRIDGEHGASVSDFHLTARHAEKRG